MITFKPYLRLCAAQVGAHREAARAFFARNHG